MKTKSFVNGLLTALLIFGTQHAQAEAYPDKPVKIVVPYAAGGANDAIARIVARKLQEDLKQTFLVENRPGAGGVVGLSSVARAAADGYTLVIGEPGAVAINPSLLKSTSYDASSFVPVASLVELPLVIVVSPSTKMRNLKDLEAFGAGKNTLYGSAGTGTVQHLTMELLKRAMKLDMTHVPYKGGAPALNGLLGGSVPVLPLSASTAQGPVGSGMAVPIAALGKTRSATFPSLPTAIEQGFPSIDVNVWQGLFAPSGTPEAVVDLLNKQIRKAITTPDVRASLTALGVDVVDIPREAFAAEVQGDVKRWAQVIKEGHLKAE